MPCSLYPYQNHAFLAESVFFMWVIVSGVSRTEANYTNFPLCFTFLPLSLSTPLSFLFLLQLQQFLILSEEFLQEG